MNPYILHLLDDIKSAHRPFVTGEQNNFELSFEDEMEIVERWATRNCDEPPSLSQQCGLSIEQFPPPEKLDEDEMKVIMEAFHQMLSTWHLEADIPFDLPGHRAYPLLINILNKEAWYFPGGMMHFDFCTGNAPDCELKEYCPCLKYWNENVFES